MELVIPDLRAGYVELARHVAETGDVVTPRGQATRELRGVTLVLKDATVCTLPVGINRRVNPQLAAIEALSLIGGVWRHGLVLRAAPGYVRVLVDPSEEGTTYAAYGPRTAIQTSQLVDQLRADPASRQAVLAIWNQADLGHTGDRPCTLNLQFLQRDGALECHVTMRSQDVWFGLAMDVFVFTQLQLTIANALDLRAGRYVHHVGSLHLYERDLPRVLELRTPRVPAPMLPHGLYARGPLTGDATWHATYGATARLMLSNTALYQPVRQRNQWWLEQLGPLFETAS